MSCGAKIYERKDVFFMDDKKNGNENLPMSKETDASLPKNSDTADFAFKWEYTEGKQNQKKKKEPNFSGMLILCILLLAAFSFFAVFTVSLQRNSAPIAESDGTEKTDESESGTKTIYIKDLSTADGVLTPQEIYTTSIGSVVSIHATAKGKEGIGTGFVYRSDGYIATAYHVINEMENISVITASGEEFAANVVGGNELCDLAVLKIEAKGLPALSLGDSSSLLVGEELVAIGTPASIEFAGTMTRGDVSYNDRVVYIYDETAGTLKKKMTLIQTSAALNPGNSGGPVFDTHGKVVGIVTMKLGSGFDGIGFAIPIDRAAPILDDMIAGVTPSSDKISAVARHAARLGIAGQNFSGKVDGKTLLGVTIAKFDPTDCDAAQKLRTGDVIVSVNGAPVANTASLSKELSNYNPADSVTVTVFRKGQLLSFSVRLIN